MGVPREICWTIAWGAIYPCDKRDVDEPGIYARLLQDIKLLLRYACNTLGRVNADQVDEKTVGEIESIIRELKRKITVMKHENTA